LSVAAMTIFGDFRGGSFRIELVDRGNNGRNDTFRIVLEWGYDSGTQRLQSGNITVRG
jgi:hypothetical protein